MHERWALNASPLILLSKIGYEWLIFELAEEIIVPLGVAEEIEAGPTTDPAKRLLREGRFVIDDAGPPLPEIIAWDLGKGETSVISYAITHPGWIAVLDDGAARKCAKSYDIRLKGTLSIILSAKQAGLIPSAAEALRELVIAGARLKDSLIREALRQIANEEWN